jgi:gliding motility-associated-like protein
MGVFTQNAAKRLNGRNIEQLFHYLSNYLKRFNRIMNNYLLLFSTFFFCINFGYAQPANDDCANAERLCPGLVLQGTTTGATTSILTDNNFCSVTSSSVWYYFTTNATGGDVTISFTNMSFNPDVNMGQQIDVNIYSATTPCTNPGTYIPQAGTCGTGGADFTFSNSVALAANTTYYVMVNGLNFGGGATLSAECDFDIDISGTAIDGAVPTASISALNTQLCEGDEETIETIISNCADTVTMDWYYNNVLISDSSVFLTSQLTEDGYLKLIINCGTVCTYADTSDSIFFEVTPVSADAGDDKYILEGDIATLDGDGIGTPLWSPGNTLTSTSIFSPTANPEITTTYFLTVSSGSCTATDSMTVFIDQLITIYSGFSPNGDDINDKWVIKNSSTYPDMEVVVYDRSGQRVFQTTGYSTPDKWWDGTNKGKALPVSTYYYVIDLRIGDEGIFKGQINIIR